MSSGGLMGFSQAMTVRGSQYSPTSFDGVTIYRSTTQSCNIDGVNHQITLDSTWGSDPGGYVVGDGTLKIPAGKAGTFQIFGSCSYSVTAVATVTDRFVTLYLNILTNPFTIGAAAKIGPLHGTGVTIGGSQGLVVGMVAQAPPSHLSVGDVVNLNAAGQAMGWTPAANTLEIDAGASLTYLTLIRLGA